MLFIGGILHGKDIIIPIDASYWNVATNKPISKYSKIMEVQTYYKKDYFVNGSRTSIMVLENMSNKLVIEELHLLVKPSKTQWKKVTLDDE